MSTFVLKREYALQLPNSYVEIDRDEMEYVDGGYLIDFNKQWLGWFVDGALVVFGGAALVGGIATLLRKVGARAVANQLVGVAMATAIYFGVHPNQSRLFSVIYGLIGVIGISPGGLIASALDAIDRSGTNGKIQF